MSCNKFITLRKTILVLSVFTIVMAPQRYQYQDEEPSFVDFSTAELNEDDPKARKALEKEEFRARREIRITEDREFNKIDDGNFAYIFRLSYRAQLEVEERLKIEYLCQMEMRERISKFFESCKEKDKYDDIVLESDNLRKSYLRKVREKLGELYKRKEHNHTVNILYARTLKIIKRELDSGYFLDFPAEDPDSYAYDIRHTSTVNASALEGTLLGNIVNRINNTKTALSAEAKIYIQELKKAIDAASSARLRHRVLTCGAYGPYA